MIQTTTNERSVLRWLTVGIVIAVVACLLVIVQVQSHYYKAALRDVRTLSADALKEVRSISDEQIASRDIRFDGQDAKLDRLQATLESLMERSRP